LLVLFGATMFLAAALLFFVQPMVAKMVLPLFGGSPAVWNTCVVFFQALLLAGYAYAHWTPKYLGSRRQALLHLVLLVIPLLLLPIAVGDTWAPPATVEPVLWLLALLLVQVGLPFFMVAATTPLLQRWLSETQHVRAKDPYLLYAASNLGSMLALISYPLFWETTLPLWAHSWLWMVGYCIVLGLLIVCAVVLWRSPPKTEIKEEGLIPSTSPDHSREHVNGLARLHWWILALVPSSLMLSVTTHLTTDVAAIPLLWVTPLAIYLLTFILTFSPTPLIPVWLARRTMPLVVLLLAIILLAQATQPAWLLIPFHLLGLFVIGMACHGELARQRPAARHLTEFYLWLALGGVCGGILNALLAPVLFNSLAEYPLVLVLACIIQRPLLDRKKQPSPVAESPTDRPKKPTKGGTATKNWLPRLNVAAAARSEFVRLDVLPALAVGVLTLMLVMLGQMLELSPGPMAVGFMFGLPAVVCYALLDRPVRYGLGIGALFLASLFYQGLYGHLIHAERTFFGIHRVTTKGSFHILVHGNTVHGQQKFPYPEPLTYYHTSSPIGRLFARTTANPEEWKALTLAIGTGATETRLGSFFLLSSPDTLNDIRDFPMHAKTVGVVGLGVGSLAYYMEPGQKWTFYEIDPTVVKIAQNPKYFTFLKSPEAELNIVLGDARLSLARDEQKFDLLILDAFNSDSLPLHLLTRDALAVYRSRLDDDGLIAFHISNRYIDLKPVLAELAADANLLCYGWDDVSGYPEESGKFRSQWVIMGKPDSAIQRIARTGLWEKWEGGNPRFLWTDDFYNVFQLFRWREDH
jgi:hypothetical protein